MSDLTIHPAAVALGDALAALQQARRAIDQALAAVSSQGYTPPTRRRQAERTTGTQILSVLSSAREPLALPDIADAVCALRRDEDEPKRGGGTRYQEIVRSSLVRLIERGLVRRVEPASRHELMKFARCLELD